ncbi:MAG: tetratricopeptide (TPR) repeat protein [Verrucomicrobiales bacterium]|jgi:tetratricopeptide (TPR) repeat protein
MGRRIRDGVFAICVAAMASCGDDPQTPASAPPPLSEAALASHQQLLAELEAIRLRTPDENQFLGDATARKLRAEVAAFGPEVSADTRFDAHMHLGIAELNLGNEREAIAAFEAALKFGDAAAIQISERYEALHYLALTNIRLGETENCCRSPSEESCIFPLKGTGIHARSEGSERAMEVLLETLAIPGLDDRRRAETSWLLNIAAMTLGRFPDAVPPNARLPIDTQGSPGSFPRFKNIAPQLGIDTFSLSGGAVADDFDGDGWLDIVVSSFDPSEQLKFWRNDGRGGFEDRSEHANFAGLFGGLNVRQADYDNDGDLDLLVLRGAYLAQYGRHLNSLLRNDGSGRFVDVTFATGLGVAHYPSQTAEWADFDLDGDLDLFIGNESDKSIRAPCQLFRNEGRSGEFVQFVDVAPAAGVENLRYAKGVSWGDFDGDRFPDLYVSNQGFDNRLYQNNQNGTFTDRAPALGVAGPSNSFPAWFWDWNNDGLLDLFVSDYSGRPSVRVRHLLGQQLPAGLGAALYTGDGIGGFYNTALSAGLDVPMLPMGSNFGDPNNDGFPDIYLGTGSPEYSAIVPNQFYLNHLGQRFEEKTIESGLGHLQKGHAVCFADFDRDGDLDIFEQMGGAFPGDRYYDALFENPGSPGMHWIEVSLRGIQTNRFGVGCRIRAVIETGGRERSVYAWVNSGGSFGGNPLTQHLGLGSAEIVKRLEIFWPVTSRTQVFENVAVDQLLLVTEGESKYEIVERSPAPFRTSAELHPLPTPVR